MATARRTGALQRLCAIVAAIAIFSVSLEMRDEI